MSDVIYEIGSLVRLKKKPGTGCGTVIEIKDTEFHGIQGFETLGIPSQLSSTLVKVYNIAWPDQTMKWHLAYELDKPF